MVMRRGLVSMLATINAKNVEPEPRNKDGVRWIAHRFPIKGGISTREAMARDFTRNNALFDRLRARNSPR